MLIDWRRDNLAFRGCRVSHANFCKRRLSYLSVALRDVAYGTYSWLSSNASGSRSDALSAMMVCFCPFIITRML